MKVSTQQLTQIFDKYGEDFRIQYLNDVVFRGTCYLSTDICLPDHAHKLVNSNVSEIEIVHNANAYRRLSQEFPASYRRPSGKLTFTQMDRKLEELRQINMNSRRKRFIRIIGDIYGVSAMSGKRKILIHHDEPLDYKKWNALKPELDRERIFSYRNSEVAIIIFVDLTANTGKEYVERFKINTDLISLMVSRIETENCILAPDFVPTEDVISVTDPESLLKEYIRTHARLLVIGEKLDESYKRALLQVREYDKYVRMLVVPSLDHSKLDHFFRQVKLVYESNRWE